MVAYGDYSEKNGSTLVYRGPYFAPIPTKEKRFADELCARYQEFYDKAVPSGNKKLSLLQARNANFENKTKTSTQVNTGKSICIWSSKVPKEIKEKVTKTGVDSDGSLTIDLHNKNGENEFAALAKCLSIKEFRILCQNCISNITSILVYNDSENAGYDLTRCVDDKGRIVAEVELYPNDGIRSFDLSSKNTNKRAVNVL